MADRPDFRSTLNVAESVYAVGAVADARRMSLSRDELVENLNLFYDTAVRHEHIVELYDETAEKYGPVV